MNMKVTTKLDLTSSTSDYRVTMNRENMNSNYSFDSERSSYQESLNDTGSFEYECNYSFRSCHELLLTNKFQDFNITMAEVNEACKSYKINEFILNTYYEQCSSKIKDSKRAAKFIHDTILNFRQRSIQMKSRSGKSINLLDLHDVEIENNLSPLEKSHLQRNVIRNIENTVKNIKLKKMSMKEKFAEHFHNQLISVEDMPCQERLNKFTELFNTFNEKINYSIVMLYELSGIIEKVCNLYQFNHCKELELKNIVVIICKLNNICTTTSILEEKAKLLTSKNKDHIQHLNNQGKELEQNVSYLKKKVDYFQKKNDIYRRKENQSCVFSDLVKEYGKLKLNLLHKQQTLSVLGEANDFGYSHQINS